MTPTDGFSTHLIIETQRFYRKNKGSHRVNDSPD